jgi:hypothetical protein
VSKTRPLLRSERALVSFSETSARVYAVDGIALWANRGLDRIAGHVQYALLVAGDAPLAVALLTQVRLLLSRDRDAEIPADLASHVVCDLRVPGHGRASARGTVHVDRMPGPLPQKLAAVLSKMPQEGLTLHALASLAGTSIGSRTTTRPSNSVRVNSLLASSMSATASLRLSRASSRVLSWALAPGISST